MGEGLVDERVYQSWDTRDGHGWYGCADGWDGDDGYGCADGRDDAWWVWDAVDEPRVDDVSLDGVDVRGEHARERAR